MSDYFKGKKVLVTGASGFIGTNVLLKLEQLMGCDLYCVINNNVLQDPTIKAFLMYRDLTKKRDCEDVVEEMDIIIHCAAVTHGAKFMNENPAALVTDNTVMNTYLLDAAHKAGVKKFVFISSGAVYPELVINNDRSFLEAEGYLSDPPDCYFGVAHMKRYVEKLCEFYSTKVKNPMQCLIVRPSNVYGPYDDFNPDTSHVMAALIKKYCDGQNPFEVWGDGEDVRDFIYVDDFVRDVLALTEKVDKFDIFNVGYGEGFSVNKILDMMGVKKKNIKHSKGKPSTVKKRLLNMDKIYKLLGYRSWNNIYDGMRKTIDWYKENKND